MENRRIFLIAGLLVVAVLLLALSGLSAPEFGAVMLGAAIAVAVVMYVISRRRRKMSRVDTDDITPPKL